MPRLPRLEYANAIYHVITRGDGRRQLFHDLGHYDRITRGLKDEVSRSSWKVLAFCWMPNHIHLLLQTPEPNLCRGMQHWLSGYANWYAKRNSRTGHLFQGRYKALLVEDASYFWSLSRYIHLNPCRGAKPLVDAPEMWPHSTYGGYARSASRVDWIVYDDLHRYWQGQNGGKSPQAAYRKYVQTGLGEMNNPLKEAWRDWALGSAAFIKRTLALAASRDEQERQRTSRRLKAITAKEIISATAAYHGVDPSEYIGKRSNAAGREQAALLCRRWTGESLSSLSAQFGLAHPDSSSNLVRRATKRCQESQAYRSTVATLERSLGLKTENQA